MRLGNDVGGLGLRGRYFFRLISQRVENVGLLLLDCADDRLEGTCDLGPLVSQWRMNVLQSDEDNAHSEFRFVRPGLHALTNFLGGSQPAVRHDVVQIDVDEVSHHLAVRQFLEQFIGVGVIVGPGQQVRDLVLHRNADREQVGWDRLLAVVFPGSLLAAGDQHLGSIF